MSKYLLIPIMPTPNGPLHLGHVAGPYLRMDILARHLRSAGHKVVLISGTDAYETHVLPRAAASGGSPWEVSRKFHRVIANCFEALDIRFDNFIEPLATDHRAPLFEVSTAIIENLHARKQIQISEEFIPFSRKHKEYLVGSHISGICPHCSDEVGGFYCERCGAELSPSELIVPQSELPDDSWEWRRYRSAFLKVGAPLAVLDGFERCCGDSRLVDIALRDLKLHDSRVRISHPGNWGQPCTLPGVSSNSVIFSYPALYAYSVFCGSLAQGLLDSPIHPFSAEADVTLVSSFGFDNVVPMLVGAYAQGLEAAGWRPFDHYLTNYFATLDGAKFSTSRGHAIWAHEASASLGVPSDVLRLYLALSNPQYRSTNFSTTDLRRFNEAWQLRTTTLIERAFAQPRSEAVGAHWLNNHFFSFFQRQSQALRVEAFDLAAGAGVIDGWLELGEEQGVSAAWVRGLALLAYPYAPRIASEVWTRTGGRGEPRIPENGLYETPLPLQSTMRPSIQESGREKHDVC